MAMAEGERELNINQAEKVSKKVLVNEISGKI